MGGWLGGWLPGRVVKFGNDFIYQGWELILKDHRRRQHGYVVQVKLWSRGGVVMSDTPKPTKINNRLDDKEIRTLDTESELFCSSRDGVPFFLLLFFSPLG